MILELQPAIVGHRAGPFPIPSLVQASSGFKSKLHKQQLPLSFELSISNTGTYSLEPQKRLQQVLQANALTGSGVKDPQNEEAYML